MFVLFLLSILIGVFGTFSGIVLLFSEKTRKSGLNIILVSVIIGLIGLGSCAAVLNSSF